MVVRVNGSKKVIDKQYRHSQQRKIQFLNLYEQRRARLTEKKMLEEKEQQEQEHRLNIRERAKSMKLNGEVRALLLRNELEDGNSQLCTRNRRAKDVPTLKCRNKDSSCREGDRQTFLRPEKATRESRQDKGTFW